jgi:serine/threonine protein kinase
MNFIKSLFDKSSHKKTDIAERFELIGRVGQGSMSKVWRARDNKTGMMVALKVLDRVRTKRFESRFEGLNKPSEGEVAVTLKHPNIVTTYEYGYTLQDEQFLVMEFVEGIGLSYLVDVQNELMQSHRLRFMIQLGEAIACFHKEGWIHRDICPRNVLISDERRVKLIDFGLVVPNTPDFQKPGNRTGTVNYMAPELIKRQRTSQQIDVFSFAVTCYEMFTRQMPWKSGETLETVLQHINQPPVDIRRRAEGIDEQVAETIMRGLKQSPRDRWRTIDAMVAELRAADKRIKYGQQAADMEGYVELGDELFEEPGPEVRPARPRTPRPSDEPPAAEVPAAPPAADTDLFASVSEAFSQLEDDGEQKAAASAADAAPVAKSNGEEDEIDKILDEVFSEPYEAPVTNNRKVWKPDDDEDDYEEAVEVAEDDDDDDEYEEV